MSKQIYVLKPSPEMITADPEVLKRLTQFIDRALSIDGEMTKALEAEMLGKHKLKEDE